MPNLRVFRLASAPEILVEEVIEAYARFTVTLEVVYKTRARHL